MDELPSSSAEIQKMLDARMEAIIAIYRFQKDQEAEGNDVVFSGTQRLYEFTQQIIVLQKRLLDALEWEKN